MWAHTLIFGVLCWACCRIFVALREESGTTLVGHAGPMDEILSHPGVMKTVNFFVNFTANLLLTPLSSMKVVPECPQVVVSTYSNFFVLTLALLLALRVACVCFDKKGGTIFCYICLWATVFSAYYIEMIFSVSWTWLFGWQISFSLPWPHWPHWPTWPTWPNLAYWWIRFKDIQLHLSIGSFSLLGVLLIGFDLARYLLVKSGGGGSLEEGDLLGQGHATP